MTSPPTTTDRSPVPSGDPDTAPDTSRGTASAPAQEPWRPGPALLAMLTGWVALFAWSGMVSEPLRFLLPAGTIGVVLALTGSGLRVVRLPWYAVAAAQVVLGLLASNLVLASRQSLLGVLPTEDSVRQSLYVIGNGAATLNAYSAPVSVNPTHTAAFLMVCALGVLLSIDVLAFGVRRAPLVALPLLVALSVPVSILNGALALPVFVGTALLFLRLLAVEHLERLATWQAAPGATPRVRLDALWQVSVAAVALALLAAPLVPVTDLLDRSGDGEGGGTSAGSFRLTTVNPFIRLRRDLVEKTDTPLVYAETDARDTGYLRTTVLDLFQDDEWRPSVRSLPPDNSADGEFPSAPGLAPGVGGRVEDWRLSFAPGFSSRWLPLPYPIQDLDIKGSWRYDSRTLDVAYVGGSFPPRALSYRATAFIPAVSARSLETAVSPPTRVRVRMTQVPDTLPDVVAERAREVTRGATTDYEKALALQNWFRKDGGFEYSLEQRPGSGMALLADFLTDDRVGYCEQFAAAMATMGRVLDIPSRVVVGFLDGTTQPDGRVLYTSDDRHAWPEMYFSGLGWVRFEPTPGQRAATTPIWTRQDPDAVSPTDAPTDVSAPDQALGSDAAAGADGTSADGSSLPRWPLGVVVVLLLAGLVPALVRGLQRRRRLAATDPRLLAEGAWAELRATAVDLGLSWPDGRSPREQARGLRAQVVAGEDDEARLEALLVQVERSRYGPPAEPAWSGGAPGGVAVVAAPEGSTRVSETVESWRRAMLAGVERGRRWRSQVWPASVVRGERR